MGGIMGWVVVHPFNTICVRMNLATASGGKNSHLGFIPYSQSIIKESGKVP
jgi:hypothetical protein